MNSPALLLVLLALPLAAAAVILAVSLFRRRGRPAVAPATARHRLQSDTAAVQGAVPATRPRRRITSGRERRADAAVTRSDGWAGPRVHQ